MTYDSCCKSGFTVIDVLFIGTMRQYRSQTSQSGGMLTPIVPMLHFTSTPTKTEFNQTNQPLLSLHPLRRLTIINHRPNPTHLKCGFFLANFPPASAAYPLAPTSFLIGRAATLEVVVELRAAGRVVVLRDRAGREVGRRVEGMHTIGVHGGTSGG